MVKKNSTIAELYSQQKDMRKEGRPLKSHYYKETFVKKIYNNYTSYRKLKIEKMTLKEFYLRKKKLIMEL